MKNQKPGNENDEKIFKINLYFKDSLKVLAGLSSVLFRFIFTLSMLLFLLLFIYYIGFVHTDENISRMTIAFRYFLLILFITRLIPALLSLEKKYFSMFFRLAIMGFTFIILLSNSGIVNNEIRFWSNFYGNGMVITGCFLIGILEIHRLFDLISSVNFPPALIFSSSFLIIILIGSGLLMLPNSRTVSMNYLDALFTSVSAVCVTGLSVVNTATSFTVMGKIIILCLIQIGGLGIMTFTGFFSFIFTSRTTLQERMLLKDMFSEESLGNLFKILIKIVLVTLILEGVGAIIIFRSLSEDMTGRWFFSIFHSVSAFCNAGFSTLKDGLMTPGTSHNFLLLSVIMILIVIGGLGFPVMIRLYAVAKSSIMIFVNKIQKKGSHARRERLDASSRIVMRTTLFLLITGALVFYAVERKNSLTGLDRSDQYFISLFNSVTARTAGFNMSNLAVIGYPAVFLMIFLMWVGASPGSTGGGIKTSTFTIALRLAWSNIRGRKNLEIFNRDINQETINRVLSIIILSIMVIGTGFFCLLLSDPGKNPVHLLFEAVSAFSTVGLSLADSATISHAGKVVIILLMFIGRVGPLTLLTGLFISGRKKYYKYPSGSIAIN
jgi:trk system potassium uptake protein TrkH